MKISNYVFKELQGNIVQVLSDDKKQYLLIGAEKLVVERIRRLLKTRKPEYIGVLVPDCIKSIGSLSFLDIKIEISSPLRQISDLKKELNEIEFQLFDSEQNPSGTFGSGYTFSYVNGIWQLEKGGQLFLVVSETRDVVSDKKPRYLALFLPEATQKQDIMRYVCRVRPVDKTLLTLV